MEHKDRSKMLTALLSMLIVCSLILVTGFGVFAYMLAWPVKIAEIKSFKVIGTDYKIGDHIMYEVIYSKYADVPGRTTKMLITLNGSFPLSDELTDVAEGINQKALRITENPIPANAKPGLARLKGVWVWPINGLRDQLVSESSNEFNIVSR
jgi:hypothetical protein